MNRMTFTVLCAFMFTQLCTGSQTLETEFAHGPLGPEVVYLVKDNNEQVGIVYVAKIPCMPRYILYNLHVSKEHRNKGIATKLLIHAIQEIAQKEGKLILIQPGPYEFGDNGECIQDTRNIEKIEALVRLYTRVGFQPAPSYYQLIATALYYLMGMTEDPKNLMVYHL